jgi:hypothetical protein
MWTTIDIGPIVKFEWLGMGIYVQGTTVDEGCCNVLTLLSLCFLFLKRFFTARPLTLSHWLVAISQTPYELNTLTLQWRLTTKHREITNGHARTESTPARSTGVKQKYRPCKAVVVSLNDRSLTLLRITICVFWMVITSISTVRLRRRWPLRPCHWE